MSGPDSGCNLRYCAANPVAAQRGLCQPDTEVATPMAPTSTGGFAMATYDMIAPVQTAALPVVRTIA